LSAGWRTVTGQQLKRLLHCNNEIVTDYMAYALESVMMMMTMMMMMMMMMTHHQRI
jgi:hypothetical protein